MIKSIHNKSILITKNMDESTDYFKCFNDFGYRITYLPTITTKEIEDKSLITDTINSLSSFNYLIFTSGNAVKHFKSAIDIDNIHEAIEVIVIGSATKRVAVECGLNISITPSEFSSAGLLKFFEERDLKNKNILIPCSLLARDELEDGLKRMGANVVSIPFYDTVMVDREGFLLVIKDVEKNKPGIFVFTSPSSFENYLKLFNIYDVPKYFEDSIIAAIGNTTSSAIAKFGVRVDIIPTVFSMEGLSASIKKYLQIE